MNYFKGTNKVHLPTLAEDTGITIRQAVDLVCERWDNWHVNGNLIHTYPNNENWYYEVCPSPFDRGQYVEASRFQNKWLQHQGRDRHVSALAHDQRWKRNADTSGSVSCQNTRVRGYLIWLEIDRKDWRGQTHFQKAIEDGKAICQKLVSKVLARAPDADPNSVCWLFSSGNASTHLAINGSLFGNPITDQSQCGPGGVWYNLAHLLAGDVRFSNGVDDPARLSEEALRGEFRRQYTARIVSEADARRLVGADLPEHALRRVMEDYPDVFLWDTQRAEQALENIDSHIYNVNSLIRQPWSIHPDSGRKKTLIGDETIRPLDIKQYPPYLIDLWLQAYKKKPKKTFDKVYESSYVIEQYKPYYPDIDKIKPDANGWVGPLYNTPFYRDTNPSVYINLNSGYLHDFGSQRYSMTLEEFKDHVQ